MNFSSLTFVLQEFGGFIKGMVCGYRSREHFKAAIYFFCGGLDLYPASS